MQNLLIEALNKQHNFNSFLGDLLKILLKTPKFNDFSQNEKSSYFLQITNNSHNSSYKNYSFKTFLKDLCSDIVFNIKRDRFEDYEPILKISSYFSLFYTLETFELDSKTLQISFSYIESSLLIEYLCFLQSELDFCRNEEVLEVVIQVNSIFGEIMAFLKGFLQEISYFNLSPLNILDFLYCYEKLLDFIVLLTNDPKSLALQDYILRGSYESLWWLLLEEKTGFIIIKIIKKALQHESDDNSLIMGFFRDNFSYLVNFFKKNIENNQIKDENNDNPAIIIWDIIILLKILPIKQDEFSLILSLTKKLMENTCFQTFQSLLQHMLDFSLQNPESEPLLIKTPLIYDTLLSIYENPDLNMRNKEKVAILSEFFNILLQNHKNLEILQNIGFIQRIIKNIHKKDFETLNLSLTILNYCFLLSPEKSLLKSSELSPIFIEIYKAEETFVIEGLLYNTKHIIKERKIVITKESLGVLLEVLYGLIRKDKSFINRFPDKELKSLLDLMESILKNEESLFLELKSHKIFNYILKIGEENSFIQFILFLINEENRLYGEKNLKKYMEIMFENIKTSREKLLEEIESFKKTEILLNIVLIARKLMKKKTFFKIFKEIHFFDQFFQVLDFLVEKTENSLILLNNLINIKEWFLLLKVLCYNNEFIQYYMKKKAFLVRKVYNILEIHGLIKQNTLYPYILSLGLVKFDQIHEKTLFSMPNLPNPVFLNYFKGKKPKILKNFILIHENLSIFIKKCFLFLDLPSKSLFFKEFFTIAPKEYLGLLITRLNKAISGVLLEDKAFFLENYLLLFKMLEFNDYRMPFADNKLPNILISHIEQFTKENHPFELSQYYEKIIAVLNRNRLDIKEIPLNQGKRLFILNPGLKSLIFTLVFWVKIPEILPEAINFIKILDFSLKKPDLSINLSQTGVIITYQSINKPYKLLFPLNEWFFLGITSNLHKNQLNISIYLNGVLKEVSNFEREILTERSFKSLLLGSPKIEKIGVSIGPLILLKQALNQKEMNLFYLLNDENGVVKVKDRDSKVNLMLLKGQNLEILDLKQSLFLQNYYPIITKENTVKTLNNQKGFIYCFMPEYHESLLLQIEGITHLYEIIPPEIQLIVSFETPLYEVFIELKARILEQRTFPCFGKGAFYIGGFEKELIGLSFRNTALLKGIEQSDFIEQVLIVLKGKGFIKEGLSFILALCRVSDEILGVIEGNSGILKEILMKNKEEIPEDLIKELLLITIKDFEDGNRLFKDPYLFYEIFLDFEFLEHYKSKLIACFEEIERLLKNKLNVFYE